MAECIPRRSFISRMAAAGLLAGVSPGTAISREFVPAPGDSDAAVFAAARREFLFPPEVAYCQTGTLGASPREVVDALIAGIQKLERDLPDWPYYQPDGEPLTGYQPLLECRSEAGLFLNAAPQEIALIQNSTMGMSFLANGLDLKPGDEVLSTDQEHPGGICGWRLQAKRRGIILKELALGPALREGPEAIVTLFRNALTSKTRIIVFSHVTSAIGALLPARELCSLAREHGALSIVDGAQATGQIRVDVKALACDAYVTSPHKWLLAPKGTGLLYISKEAQSKVWTTLASGSFDDQASGAYRFMQYGTGSVPVVDGLRAALRFINRIGMDRIERWDAMLTKRLRDGLAHLPKVRFASPADPRMTAAISTFAVTGHTGRQLQDALWDRKIRVRSQGDERGVRLSAHLYVSPQDIDRVLEVVQSLK